MLGYREIALPNLSVGICGAYVILFWFCHGFMIGVRVLRDHEFALLKHVCFECVGLMLVLSWLCDGGACTEVS